MNIFGRNNIKRIILKNADGSYYGSISIHSPNKNTKKKRLSYNFKQVSALIMRSKTSSGARQAVAKARQQVVMLQRKNVQNGDYDPNEVRNAIVHAQKIERVAKKKLKHLKQEEELAKGKNAFSPDFEEQIQGDITEEMGGEELLELSEEELERMLEDLRQAMEETETALADTEDEADPHEQVMESINDAADLEKLKKKHRSDELHDILEADMKYLKAVFERLAREKQNASSGASRGSSSSQGAENPQNPGVTLELGGAEIPVQPAEAPVMPDGGSFDTTV